MTSQEGSEYDVCLFFVISLRLHFWETLQVVRSKWIFYSSSQWSQYVNQNYFCTLGSNRCINLNVDAVKFFSSFCCCCFEAKMTIFRKKIATMVLIGSQATTEKTGECYSLRSGAKEQRAKEVRGWCPLLIFFVSFCLLTIPLLRYRSRSSRLFCHTLSCRKGWIAQRLKLRRGRYVT